MADLRFIPVANLRLDPTNPRLAIATSDQTATLRAIAAHQGTKLRVLASDIVHNGTNPSELIIALRTADQAFTVLEGNRRLSAILALNDPDIIDGAVSAPVLTAIRNLSEEYAKNPIEELHCVIVEDVNDAQHWLELRHTGELGGAGLSPWGADDRQRFRARSGLPIPIHTQALNFLEQRGDITAAERRNIPTTTLQRLLGAPDVRAKLGIQWSRGVLTFLAPADDVAKALIHVVSDIAAGRIHPVDVYSKKLRSEYAQQLPADIVVAPVSDTERQVAISWTDMQQDTDTAEDPPERGPAEADLAPHQATNTHTPQRSSMPRDHLIPQDCRLGINVERISHIEGELKSLSLDNHINAVSVLFRVFIELSADAYIHRVGLARPAPEQDTLAGKLNSITDHLVEHNKLTREEAIPARRAAQRDSFLAPSLKLIQQWVHNPHMFPAPGDLRAHWSSLQPWFVAVWTV